MPTIIRAMDYYMPIYSEWKDHGIKKECTCCWENLNNAIHQASAAYNVPVARVYDVSSMAQTMMRIPEKRAT